MTGGRAVVIDCAVIVLNCRANATALINEAKTKLTLCVSAPAGRTKRCASPPSASAALYPELALAPLPPSIHPHCLRQHATQAWCHACPAPCSRVGAKRSASQHPLPYMYVRWPPYPQGAALARAPAHSAVRFSTSCRWSLCGCQQSRSMRPRRPVPWRAPASRRALPGLALCSATCIGEHAASQQQLRLPAVPLHAAASRVAGSGVARERRSGLPCCSRSPASLALRIALRKRFLLACS